MKILSNKKYNELILKSCKGMFGAVTDDMLLRDNALLNEENKQLKEKLDKYENPEDMTLMFMYCEEKAKDKIKELQQENQKYKEVIFKIKMIISVRIKEYQKKIDNEIDMGSQGDHFKICRYEENIKFLKDILKEVE